MEMLLFTLMGLIAGIAGGFFGLGGGLIMVPSLVYLFKFDQHLAQGTSLAAMVPPIALLAAYRYWISGHVTVYAAVWICAGLFIGALFGAHGAHWLTGPIMRKAFGIILLLVSLRMIIEK